MIYQVENEKISSQKCSCKLVCLLRSSIIGRAHEYSKYRPIGPNLFLERYGTNCDWTAQPVLFVSTVLYSLLDAAYKSPPSDNVVLHCGGNDIGLHPLGYVHMDIKDLLQRIMTSLPNTVLIWSCILPRTYWRYSTNYHAMDQARCRIMT